MKISLTSFVGFIYFKILILSFNRGVVVSSLITMSSSRNVQFHRLPYYPVTMCIYIWLSIIKSKSMLLVCITYHAENALRHWRNVAMIRRNERLGDEHVQWLWNDSWYWLWSGSVENESHPQKLGEKQLA